MPDHGFHASIIAYCQQNQYVQIAAYTTLFTLSGSKKAMKQIVLDLIPKIKTRRHTSEFQ